MSDEDWDEEGTKAYLAQPIRPPSPRASDEEDWNDAPVPPPRDPSHSPKRKNYSPDPDWNPPAAHKGRGGGGGGYSRNNDYNDRGRRSPFGNGNGGGRGDRRDFGGGYDKRGGNRGGRGRGDFRRGGFRGGDRHYNDDRRDGNGWNRGGGGGGRGGRYDDRRGDHFNDRHNDRFETDRFGRNERYRGDRSIENDRRDDYNRRPRSIERDRERRSPRRENLSRSHSRRSRSRDSDHRPRHRSRDNRSRERGGPSHDREPHRPPPPPPPRRIKQERVDDREYEWGGGRPRSPDQKRRRNDQPPSPPPPPEKEKPNFGLSGKLTEDANKVNGVVIKYAEPQEARKPKRRWRLYPFKGTETLQTMYIHRQSCYLIGRDRKICDLPVDHPSCSKQHAVLQYRLVPFKRDDGSTGKRVRPYIIDLESANGTYLNNEQIGPRKFVELMEKDVLKFGFSSREYVLLHENSKEDQEDDDVRGFE